MYEFLLLLGLVWLIIASYEDIKKREVANWLSFSLIIFALGYRGIYAVINNEIMFFIYGLFGFFVFFILAYMFYYARVFAGGDAKLLMGLGVVLSLSSSFFENIIVFGFFIFILMLIGSVYGLFYSFILVFKNKNKFVKEFKKQFKLKRKLIVISLIFGLVSLGFVFVLQDSILFLLTLFILMFPIIFIYSKAVEESCMIVEVSGSKVTIGDWLYEEVKINGKKIKPYWEGLSEKEVKILRKSRKKIKIKQGIPFVPVFLISYVVLLIGFLRNS